MLKSALMAAALVLSAGFANAVTIEPGKSYVGDYTFVGVSPTTEACCPVISIDSLIRAPSLQVYLGPNILDSGETISLRFDVQAPVQPGQEDRNLFEFTATPETHGTYLGFFIGQVFDNIASGQIGIEAFSGSFDITRLEVQGQVDATLQQPNGPDFSAILGITALVTNIREVGAQPPPPSPIPLPAALPLMLAGLLGLGLVGRRRKAA